MTLRWYALRSKPRKEDVVWKQLQSHKIEHFYPRLRVNPVNPRSRKYKPYFPGYLFVRVDLEETGLSVFKWMPHTMGLVSFGDEPAPVPDNLLFEISRRLEQINQAGGEKLDGLNQGDAVMIEHGPFAGYEAIFDSKLPGSERVRVLLKLLSDSRQIPVEIDASHIRKFTGNK